MNDNAVTHSADGRPYLKLSEAKEGLVELDEGFTCHVGGKCMLHRIDDGPLFFYCDAGKHDISGQADDDEHCIGIYEVQP